MKKTIEIDVAPLYRTGSDEWAKSSAVHIAWLRQACPQLGLDTHRMITAKILSSIVSEDYTHFGAFYMPDAVDCEKRNIQTCLTTEINTPETPEDIREQLNVVKTELAEADWESRSGYTRAVNVWISGARDFVREQIASKSDYQHMIAEYHAVTPILRPQWRQFLKRRP